MKTLFKELFEYNHHCNHQLAVIFENNHDKISEKSMKLFSHVLNAHHIWNSRINGNEHAYTVWEVHDTRLLKMINASNYEETLHLLEKTDLAAMLSYTNSKAQTFSNNVRDILFHVINHSTYHRGQMAADFKYSGLEPLNTDYIFFKR